MQCFGGSNNNRDCMNLSDNQYLKPQRTCAIFEPGAYATPSGPHEAE